MSHYDLEGGLGLKRRDAFKAAGFAALASGVVAGDRFRQPPRAEVVIDRIRYVSSTGDDAGDGHSWATAKRSLQSAYDSLGANDYPHGGLVLVDIGDYDVGPGLTYIAASRRSFVAWPGRSSSRPPTRTWHLAGSHRQAAPRRW
jgi:hypothetical protein